MAFLDPALTYGNTKVELTLARNDVRYAGLGTGQTQIGVGAALDSLERNAIGDASGVIDALKTLTVPEVGPALDAIGGIGLMGIPRSMQVQSRALTQQISSRLNVLQHASTVASFANEFDRGVLLAMNDSDTEQARPVYVAALSGASADTRITNTNSGIWLRGVGGAGNFDVTSTADANFSSVGLLGGFDQKLNDGLILGVLAGYSDSQLDQNTPSSNSDVTSWRIGGYGRWQPARVHIDALLSYGGDRFETVRHLAIGTLDRNARANFDGHTYNAYLEVGYTLPWTPYAPVSIDPYFGLQWTSQTHDTYSETGAGALNLIVPEETADSLRGVTGLRVEYRNETIHAGMISAEIRGAWAHEFIGEAAVSARLSGDPTGTVFQARGRNFPSDSALLGTGISFQKDRHWRVFADFDAELNAAQETFGVSAGVRYSW